jgi:hypothetical protein
MQTIILKTAISILIEVNEKKPNLKKPLASKDKERPSKILDCDYAEFDLKKKLHVKLALESD